MASHVVPLIRSFGVYHHLTNDEKLSIEIVDDKGNTTPNRLYQLWDNDRLLTSWLLGTMKEEVLSMIFSEVETAYEI
ncbi:hypothetical protein Ddye_009913 [Dipteronia dyeriana]|uniref:Uncharacterized protein n=1 Tax=Dipteronia dyeriana TaxID=168575 RepID=A0AAE0CMS8_9ROSI|nr:hypothetical protein Ddye_009913 [Dipteronia dyeriana]